MHHDRSKTVLSRNEPLPAIADRTGRSVAGIEKVLRESMQKLLERRKARTAPLIDRALYPSLNGMMIAAHFRAYQVLGDPALLDPAINALDRILRGAADGLRHAEGVPGLLEDYVHLVDALAAGYEATGQARFLDKAETIMAVCMEKFLDRQEGGFFDTEEEVLGTRLKRIEDVPHPSPNAVAIQVLLRLASLTDKENYFQEAERSLRLFAGLARTMGVHAGSYFCALDAYYRRQTLTIESAAESTLARDARLAAARSYSAVLYGIDLGRLIPCRKGLCSEPVGAIADLPSGF
jgi:uncharacterized protein YyaL (SSP411 family)